MSGGSKSGSDRLIAYRAKAEVEVKVILCGVVPRFLLRNSTTTGLRFRVPFRYFRFRGPRSDTRIARISKPEK
jgi:hypothetical protein